MTALSIGLGLGRCIAAAPGDIPVVPPVPPVVPPVVADPPPQILLQADRTVDIEVAEGAVILTIADTGLYDGIHAIDTADFAAGPVFLAPPSAPAGGAAPGDVLTAYPGLLAHPAGSAPSVTRRWTRDGAAILGAAGATYTLVAADQGAAIAVTEIADGAGGGRSADGAALAIPANAPAALPAAPTITVGTQPRLAAIAAGAALSTAFTPGAAAASDGAAVTETVTYAVGGTTRAGSDAATAQGDQLTASVVYTAPGAAATAPIALGPVTIAAPPAVAPSNTALPAVTGTARVGRMLALSTGIWSGTAPIAYAFQWQRGTTDIAGATGATYVAGTADAGQTLRGVVTATNAAGGASATSPATAAIGAATLLDFHDPGTAGAAMLAGMVLDGPAGDLLGTRAKDEPARQIPVGPGFPATGTVLRVTATITCVGRGRFAFALGGDVVLIDSGGTVSASTTRNVTGTLAVPSGLTPSSPAAIRVVDPQNTGAALRIANILVETA